MKVIVAGSRSIESYALVGIAIINSGFDVSEIVSGGARGVDTLAIEYAKRYKIPYVVFLADWSRHGRAAGVIRNQEMAEYADALVAIWDGKSRGTYDMIDRARALFLNIYIEQVDQPEIK